MFIRCISIHWKYISMALFCNSGSVYYFVFFPIQACIFNASNWLISNIKALLCYKVEVSWYVTYTGFKQNRPKSKAYS